MAKGQRKTSKEIRKPKAAKPKTEVVTASSILRPEKKSR